jgi:glycosyltransferase EpsH
LVTAWGKIYKTEIIKNHKIQFTDTKLIGTEDALFNIQYLEYAEKVKFLICHLYNYLKITEFSYQALQTLSFPAMENAISKNFRNNQTKKTISK